MRMASDKFDNLPPPPEDPDSDVIDECRLWIGNIDNRVTEYTLLKLVQKFGDLEKFDYLYHKYGPDKGKPRGYCFVTFKNKQDTDKARKSLHGKFALSKRLVAKNAHKERKDDIVTSRQLPRISGMALQGNQSNAHSLSAETQIRAIETKLKLMERGEKSSSPSTTAPSTLSQTLSRNTHNSGGGNRNTHSSGGGVGYGKHHSAVNRTQYSKPYGRPTGKS